MKFRIAILAACLLIASRAAAAVSLCAITGVVTDGAGNPVPNAVVTFNSQNTQVISGNTIAPIFKSASTDANGNLSSISLAQGLFVQVTVCQAQGGGCGAAQTAVVPLATTITFANLLTGTISAGTASTGFGANVTPFGSQSSGTQTCSISGACSVTLTSSSVTLDSAPPANPTSTTQIMVWQVTQDATGGRIPTWGPHMHFSSIGGGPGSPVVPITTAGATEQFTFVWNPIEAKWDYQARGGMQLVPPSNQGGNNSLGLGNGNGASNSPATAPANVWTQVASDNGGFFTSQGGGVAFYDYLVWGEYTICNPNSSTEFFSAYCTYTGSVQRVDPDHEIDGGQCIDVPIFTVNGNLAGPTQFASFFCYVNPTNALTVLWHSYFTEELPVS